MEIGATRRERQVVALYEILWRQRKVHRQSRNPLSAAPRSVSDKGISPERTEFVSPMPLSGCLRGIREIGSRFAFPSFEDQRQTADFNRGNEISFMSVARDHIECDGRYASLRNEGTAFPRLAEEQIPRCTRDDRLLN